MDSIPIKWVPIDRAPVAITRAKYPENKFLIFSIMIEFITKTPKYKLSCMILYDKKVLGKSFLVCQRLPGSKPPQNIVSIYHIHLLSNRIFLFHI